MTDSVNKLKATDYLTESLKLLVGVSMSLVAGLVAYDANLKVAHSSLLFYLSSLLLLTASILAICNILMLINKIYRNELNAIKNVTVRNINFGVLITFAFGVFFGLLYIFNNPILDAENIHQKKSRIDSKLTILIDKMGNIERKISNMEVQLINCSDNNTLDQSTQLELTTLKKDINNHMDRHLVLIKEIIEKNNEKNIFYNNH